MAIEIKELNVKLHLNQSEKVAGESTSSATTSENAGDDLVTKVAARVLNILKEQQER